MPRQLRLDFPCALHHVMSRGIERKDIFIHLAHYLGYLASSKLKMAGSDIGKTLNISRSAASKLIRGFRESNLKTVLKNDISFDTFQHVNNMPFLLAKKD